MSRRRKQSYTDWCERHFPYVTYPRLVPLYALVGVVIAWALLYSEPADKWKIKPSLVIVYAAQDQVYAEPILREFEKKTGIKVKAIYDSEAVKTVGLANRLLAERSHPQCDVFWGNEEMRTRQLAAQGVFRETNGWAAFGYRSRRMVINTNFISLGSRRGNEADQTSAATHPPPHVGGYSAPASLLELTNASWRGKMALAFPQFGTTATHFHALKQLWGENAWLAWCRALAANKPFIVDGNSVAVKFVGRGEAWIGLTDSDDIAAGQREGFPIAAVPLIPALPMNRPTPNPSKEGSRPVNARAQFPSWEGLGVGSGEQIANARSWSLSPGERAGVRASVNSILPSPSKLPDVCESKTSLKEFIQTDWASPAPWAAAPWLFRRGR